jgi:hypothetical protein
LELQQLLQLARTADVLAADDLCVRILALDNPLGLYGVDCVYVLLLRLGRLYRDAVLDAKGSHYSYDRASEYKLARDTPAPILQDTLHRSRSAE